MKSIHTISHAPAHLARGARNRNRDAREARERTIVYRSEVYLQASRRDDIVTGIIFLVGGII